MKRHMIGAAAIVASLLGSTPVFAQPAAGPPGAATGPAEKLAPGKAAKPSRKHHVRPNPGSTAPGVAAKTGAGADGSNLDAAGSRSQGTTPPAEAGDTSTPK